MQGMMFCLDTIARGQIHIAHEPQVVSAWSKVYISLDCEQAKEVIPNEVGFRFKTYEDFKSIIDSTKDGNGVTEEDVKFFFDSNWESNYCQIIQ